VTDGRLTNALVRTRASVNFPASLHVDFATDCFPVGTAGSRDVMHVLIYLLYRSSGTDSLTSSALFLSAPQYGTKTCADELPPPGVYSFLHDFSISLKHYLTSLRSGGVVLCISFHVSWLQRNR